MTTGQKQGSVEGRIRHPLDPLTPEELRAVVSIVYRDCELDSGALFETVMLQEPNITLVRTYRPGTKIDREAFVAVLNRTGKTYEGIVSVTSDRVKSWCHLPGVQPRMMSQEMEQLTQVVKSHPDYIAALRKRGIEDLSKVLVGWFPQGRFPNEEGENQRITRAHSQYIETPGDNPHVRPIEGLAPVVDLNTKEVLRVEDFGHRPIPPENGNYGAASQPKLRDPLARLEIIQPEGPGFKVDGHHVSWESWSFRVGFTPREGMVLHTISYSDNGQERPVVYRASLAELVVPYAETDNDHFRNHSFDLGESVFGNNVNSLKLGCDCLGDIHYLDVNMANDKGEPVTFPNAICLHEEDFGVLWKHTDPFTGKSEVRRSRRMVVSSFYTAWNYDYGIYWYFYLDGSIEFEAKLTGILYCGAVEDGQITPYGRLVAPNVNAMIHEHYFNVRLDMNVDGDSNTVVEVEADLVPMGPGNPHGNAHGTKETLLDNECTAARDIDPALGRFWKVINRNQKNGLGEPTGYRLVPGSNVKPMHQPGSPFMRRAGFVEHDLWVTPFNPKELYPSGSYVNMSAGGDGLPTWTEAARPIKDQDLVLWYTAGMMHVPRPEDFPIMSVERTGFKLQPVGFFDRNPSLDLPPSSHNHGAPST